MTALPSRPCTDRPGRALVGAACLIAFFGAMACKSRSSLPRTMPVTKEMRAEAQQATELGKWAVAAQRWYSILVDSGLQDRVACGETARAMMHLNDPESALRVLEQGLERHGDAAELHELKGDALVQQNFRRAAEHAYEMAVKLDPKSGSAWRALGRVRIDLGYEGAAVEPLQRAIDLGRDDFATRILLARAKCGSGDPCGAFQAYVLAFQHGKGQPEQYVDASMLYLNEIVRRVHKDAAPCAQAWLEKAIELDDKFVQAHFELGVLKEDLGKQDEAIAHYRKAIDNDRAFLPALRNLALLYFARKDEANTHLWVKRALEHERDPERRKALENMLEPLAEDGASPPQAARDGRPN